MGEFSPGREKSMRIVVNDIAASTGGALTVLCDFYNYIRSREDTNEWIFLIGGDYLKSTQNIQVVILEQVKKSRIKRLRFDYCTGRRFIESLKPDIVFSLQNTIVFGLKCQQIVYVHQPLPFQDIKRFSFFKADERKLAIIQYCIGAIIKRSAVCADKVIVQTEWMREAVCRKCGINESRIEKITPTVDSGAFAIESKHGEFEASKFFYPTSTAKYKNCDTLLKAARILEGRGQRFELMLTTESGEYESKCIKYVGKLPYESVIRKYYESCLVFPSYIETFGYPLAEARMAGTIILASDTPFAREVLDGYENAYFFDPFDCEALANLMEKVITGAIPKKEMRPQISETCESSWSRVYDVLSSFAHTTLDH